MRWQHWVLGSAMASVGVAWRGVLDALVRFDEALLPLDDDVVAGEFA